MDNEENFISAIHNYCDRWCVRCEFTARCRVFAMEAEMSDEEKDIGNEAFARNLSNMLKDAKAMLEEKAAEFGIELNGRLDGDLTAQQEQKWSAVESSDMAVMAEKYAFDLIP